MADIVTNVLLGLVVVTAAVFILFISKRDKGGMTKKQTAMMVRILISAAIMLGM